MVDYLPFIIFLMILAVFLRAESALTVIYMVIGTFLLGFWWNKRSLGHVEITRNYDTHAFLGDVIPVQLEIKNNSILPILWIEIHEGLPVDVRAGRVVKHVFSLGIRETKVIPYDLVTKKRGFYPIGPLLLSTGDPLGLLQPTEKEYPSSSLTVYPQIVNLSAFRLPSRSPFGTIKHHNPIFQDPSRILGKRSFQNGDSIRHIDWKSTAVTGQLQVKQFEASIALEVVVILDLHQENYSIKSTYKDTELAVTTAASVAAWGKHHHQSIGLVTNGTDPYHGNQMPNPIQPKKGANHFINILEILARIQPGDNLAVEDLIENASSNLSWGATIVFISGSFQDATLDILFKTRKRGINPVMLFIGQSSDFRLLKKKAEYFKITLYKANDTLDLKTIGTT